MGRIEGERMTDSSTIDPLTAAAQAAWLDFAKGTYSTTDQRIFVAGFMAGNRHRQRQEKQQRRYEDDYERKFGSRRDCY